MINGSGNLFFYDSLGHRTGERHMNIDVNSPIVQRTPGRLGDGEFAIFVADNEYGRAVIYMRRSEAVEGAAAEPPSWWPKGG